MTILISLIVLGVSVLVMLVSSYIQKLGERWNQLPSFKWNCVGGVLGVVGVTDYKNAVGANRVEGLVVIPETLTLSHHPLNSHTLTMPPYRSVRDLMLDGESHWFSDKEDSKDLFVPFASEQYLSFADQEKRFAPIPDAKKFFEKKRRENEAADVRMRYGSLISRHSYTLSTIWGWAMVFLILSVFSALFGLLSLSNRTMDIQPIIVYTTSPDGGVTETRTTYKEQFNLPVKNQDHFPRIYTGNVIELVPIGGNISQVCIPYGDRPHLHRVLRIAPQINFLESILVGMGDLWIEPELLEDPVRGNLRDHSALEHRKVRLLAF